MKKISIIGFGRVGSNLFYSLKQSGFQNLFKIDHSHYSNWVNNKLSKCEVIFICTKDSTISSVVSELILNKIILNNKTILHTSGSISSDVLLPLKKRGAQIGSFHPVQSFNRKQKRVSKINESFKNIYIVVEGDKKAILVGKKIASSLGSKTLILSKDEKIVHHICCVIASNYLITLLSQLEELTNVYNKLERRKSGKEIFPDNLKLMALLNEFKNLNLFNIYKPLILSTLIHAEKFGCIKSLTGPIERNDYLTVETHLKTLSKHCPNILPFYIFMGSETIKLTLKKYSKNKIDFSKFTSLFKKYSKYDIVT